MHEPPELTAKEQFHASLYKDPQALFRKALLRSLGYLVPSLSFMVAWFMTNDSAYVFIGYGILFYQAIARLFLAKKGIATTRGLLAKYEVSRTLASKGD